MNDKHKNEVRQYQVKEPKFNLTDSVVLPMRTKAQIDEAIAKIKFHKKIYEDWGFSAVDPLGRSTILNFFGPPGTGKTLVAEALAGTLGMKIIQIGIAEVESKFMGETAKNIQEAFKTAYELSALLFFDEADTLLGKRLSSVTQGVDNEVNSMRSTMLIELEKFNGIVIFATNFAKNYDEAFRSRISHHIKFYLPDSETRASIWNKFLVEAIPLEDSRDEVIKWCSELTEGFSGREIRTCLRLALPKPFMEAENTASTPVLKLEHLKSAIMQIKASVEDVAHSSVGKKYTEPSSVDISRKFLGLDN